MIQVVMGKGVGAGKSYYVAGEIAKVLAYGGTVYAANTFGIIWEPFIGPMPLCQKGSDSAKSGWPVGKPLPRPMGMAHYVAERYGVEIEPDQFHEFDEDDIPRLHEITPPGTPECPVLVVVDEGQGKLNARDWNDENKRAFFRWLTQSRHDDNDVMFLSQHMHNLDKQILRLVTYVVRVRNMAFFSIAGFINWPFKEFWIYRMDGDSNHVLWKDVRKYDWGLFGAYRTKQMRGKHKRLLSEGVRRKQLKKIQKKPMRFFFYVAIGLVAVLIFGGWHIYREHADGGIIPRSLRPAPLAAVSTPPPGLLRASAPLRDQASVKSTVKALVGGAWDVSAEEFRGTDGISFLHTDKFEYVVGEMSPGGYVEAVSAKGVARLREADGRIMFVVTEAHQRPDKPPESTPLPVYRSGEMSAKWEPPASAKWADEEQSKIRKGLERPIGSK